MDTDSPEPKAKKSHSGQHNHHHDHGTADVSDKALVWAIVLNLGLSVFEFLAGVFAGSVALMADALHNTNDAAALVVAFVARKIGRRMADEKFTFGYRRAELIGAIIQLTALIVVGLYLLGEAIGRYFEPESIKGSWVMAASCIAIVVDFGTAWLLWAMSKGSMNVKAAFLHNITDAAASVAVLLGGAAIYFFDWTWIDPTLTLLIAGYILFMSLGLLRRTAKILMEGTPDDLDLEHLAKEVCRIPGVESLHHLHAWELDEEHRAFEGHLIIAEETSPQERHTIRSAAKKLLEAEFRIGHSTIELETAAHGCNQEGRKLIHQH